MVLDEAEFDGEPWTAMQMHGCAVAELQPKVEPNTAGVMCRLRQAMLAGRTRRVTWAGAEQLTRIKTIPADNKGKRSSRWGSAKLATE